MVQFGWRTFVDFYGNPEPFSLQLLYAYHIPYIHTLPTVTATAAVIKYNQILERYQKTCYKSQSEDQGFYLQDNLLRTYCSKILEYQNIFPTWLGRCHFHDVRQMDASLSREGYAWLNSL